MIIGRSTLIFLHLKTPLKQKRHEFQIDQKTTYDDLAQKVKELYKIAENKFDLMVKQDSRDVILNQQNIQLFKKTVHLNKIVKVQEYDILNLTYLDANTKIQQAIEKEVEINEQDLQAINDGQFISDYSSFLADDFHQMVPFLQGICAIKSEVKYNQHEQLSLKLIEQVSTSIRPALENFYSKQDNISRLKLN